MLRRRGRPRYNPGDIAEAFPSDEEARQVQLTIENRQKIRSIPERPDVKTMCDAQCVSHSYSARRAHRRSIRATIFRLCDLPHASTLPGNNAAFKTGSQISVRAQPLQTRLPSGSTQTFDFCGADLALPLWAVLPFWIFPSRGISRPYPPWLRSYITLISPVSALRNIKKS